MEYQGKAEYLMAEGGETLHKMSGYYISQVPPTIQGGGGREEITARKRKIIDNDKFGH